MRSDAQSQSGSSLFEVLVSVLILGLGLLGVLSVQTSALRNASYSLELSYATNQAQAIMETMRSHRHAALAGQYHTGGFVCDVQAGSEIGRWIDDLQKSLGETACGEIVCPSGAVWCRVIIRWGAVSADSDEIAAHELTTGARL